MTQTYQTGFKTILGAALAAAGTTATLATVPTVTEGRLLLVNGNIKEWISFTGVSGSTVTGLTRGLSQTADPATAGTGLDWGAGTQVILVAMHDQLPDKLEDTTYIGALSAPDISFTNTTTGGLKVKSLTTVQRDALTPANGHIIYNTTDGEFQIRQGGAWSTMASGSTQADASTTIAGKVEIATSAESIAGTDTGGTGAKLVVLPSDLAKNTQSGTFVYGTDAGGDDTYVVALTPTLVAYTAGQRLNFKPTTANTGACTVDFGPGVKNIKTIDGNDPQTGVIRANGVYTVVYDGTSFILQNEDFATTANKGIVEMATDAEATTGTDETRYINPKQAKDNYFNLIFLASDTLRASADTTRALSGETVYTKFKEIALPTNSGAGTIRVKFLRTYTSGNTLQTTVYVNGSAVPATAENSTTTATRSYDISASPGDLIQLYAFQASGVGDATLANFRLYYDNTPKAASAGTVNLD